MTKRDIQLIRSAQDYCRRLKGKNDIIDCPFRFSDATHLCITCHKWMGTDVKIHPHPCMAMDKDRVIDRFWQPCKEVY